MARRGLLLAVVGILVVGLSVVAQNTPDKYGGTLTFGATAEPAKGFVPILGNGMPDLMIYQFCAEPLTWGGENYPSEVRPILAESWEMSEDGLSWTIHLRHGVLWQDGQAFTADDVVFWAQTIQDPAAGAVYFMKRFYVGDVPHRFEKIDDYTVRVTTAKPVYRLMQDICVPLIPRHIFVDNGITSASLSTSVWNTQGCVGTGPFKVVSYSRGEAIVLERNETYWGGRPYLDRLIIRIVPDADALVSAMLTGEVDWARLRTGAVDLDDMQSSPNLMAMTPLIDYSTYIGVNVKKPMLADKRTRQAMLLALDREAMVGNLLGGLGLVMDAPWNKVVTAYTPMTGYDYNVGAAEQLLSSVGWEKGSDGTLRAKNVAGVSAGTRFAIEYCTTSASDNLPILVQAYLREIGIDVTIRLVDQATLAAENDGKADKPFDLQRLNFGYFGSNAGAYARAFGTGDASVSQTSYDNPETARLFTLGSNTADPAVADTYYREAADIVWDELPVLPLFQQMRAWGISKRVHTEEAVANAGIYSQFEYMSKIWVDR
ncbi:MAG: ABC transporter substrate-binding protein [Candidatus Bipolaricaulia bacterium]